MQPLIRSESQCTHGKQKHNTVATNYPNVHIHLAKYRTNISAFVCKLDYHRVNPRYTISKLHKYISWIVKLTIIAAIQKLPCHVFVMATITDI